MKSPFTQPLSHKNFLIKTKRHETATPSTDGMGISGSNAATDRKPAPHRRLSRPSSGISSRYLRSGTKDNMRSISEHRHQRPQTYEDTLGRLPDQGDSSARTSATSSNNDLVGHFSCHNVVGMNKPRVRFGGDDRRRKCRVEIDHVVVGCISVVIADASLGFSANFKCFVPFFRNSDQSCPMIDEDTRPPRHLDLTTLSKTDPCLSALSTRSRKPQTVVLRRENPKDVTSNLFLESIQGVRLAFMEGEAWRCEGQRVMTDTNWNPYAIIIHSLSGGGKNLFRICGIYPLYAYQRKNRETGLYTHAEVKNAGGIGVISYTMNARGESPEEYATDFFGPSIFSWGRGRPTRGVIIKNVTTGDECARMTFLGRAKTVLVEPDNDIRLMICFAAIIEEMIGKRMR
jgi:hypothetical protein